MPSAAPCPQTAKEQQALDQALLTGLLAGMAREANSAEEAAKEEEAAAEAKRSELAAEMAAAHREATEPYASLRSADAVRLGATARGAAERTQLRRRFHAAALRCHQLGRQRFEEARKVQAAQKQQAGAQDRRLAVLHMKPPRREEPNFLNAEVRLTNPLLHACQASRWLRSALPPASPATLQCCWPNKFTA